MFCCSTTVGHAHDGALAELLFDAGKRDGQRLLALVAFLAFHGLGACAVVFVAMIRVVFLQNVDSFHPFK